MKLILRIIFAAILALAPLHSEANIGDFGFGSRTAGLAGANVAWGFDAFAAYSNPAGLPQVAKDKLRIGYGWLYLNPEFKPIDSVVLENNVTSDKLRSGNVADDYRSTLGQVIGGAVRLTPSWGNLSVGVTLFNSVDPLGFTDSGESFIPEYVLYRARTQRPQIELGLGSQISDQFSLGLGIHVGYGITANGTAFLQTANGTTSSMRVIASLKPQASPNLGWLLKSQESPDETGSWTIGQVLRAPNNAQAALVFNSSARAFGTLAALDLNFAANASMFYDPLALETGLSWKHSPRGRLFLQADFQNWTKFKRPSLKIEAQKSQTEETGGAEADLLVNPSNLPALALKNIWIPKIAEEIHFESSTLRFGYSYRPSIFYGTANDSGNYLDPPKHIVTAGYGLRFQEFFGWSVPATLDFHATYHQLSLQKVTKNLSTDIGAPGYSAGGKLWGGGASLNLEL